MLGGDTLPMVEVTGQFARNVQLRDIDIQNIIRLSKDGHSAGEIASELNVEEWIVEMIVLLLVK